MFKTRSVSWAAALVAVAVAAGCDSGPDLVTVTGAVTQEGKPVSHAAVTFNPDPSNSSVLLGDAITDSEGNYRLISDERNGAVPGKYHVIIERAPGAPPAGAVGSTASADFEDDPYMASLTSGAGFIEPHAKSRASAKKKGDHGPIVPGEGEKYTFDIEVAGKGGAIDFELKPKVDAKP